MGALAHGAIGFGFPIISTPLVALLIDEQISQLFNWGMGASLAFILLFVTLGVFLVANRVVGFDRILGAGREA